MGHEYVELKNPAAAIESYRRAIGYIFSYTFFVFNQTSENERESS